MRTSSRTARRPIPRISAASAALNKASFGTRQVLLVTWRVRNYRPKTRSVFLLPSLASSAKLGSVTSAYETGRVPEIKVHHRLRIAREAAGLEQTQLAELVGVSRNSISNAEIGRHAPRQILLNAWALATGVPVSWLETGKNPSAPSPDGGNEGRPSLPYGATRGAAWGNRTPDLFIRSRAVRAQPHHSPVTPLRRIAA